MAADLGDCLLHADHHPLTAECYEAASVFFARQLLEHGRTEAEARERMALLYEERVLRAVWSLR